MEPVKPAFWCRSLNVCCPAPDYNSFEAGGRLTNFEFAVESLYSTLYADAVQQKMAVLSVSQFTHAVPHPHGQELMMHVLFYVVAQVLPYEEIERQQRVTQLDPGGSRPSMRRL